MSLQPRTLERTSKNRELPASTDEGHIKALREGRHVREDLNESPRLDGLRFALQFQRRERLGAHRLAHELVRELAEHDLARASRVLEASCDVHRVARGIELAAFGIAGDDLTRIDARAYGEANARLTLKLSTEQCQALGHLGRRPDGAQSVVLVHDRDAEHSHDRVADELLHQAAMPLENSAHFGEVHLHHSPKRLGIESLAQIGRAGHVREDDRDRFARLAHGAECTTGSALRLTDSKALRRGVRQGNTPEIISLRGSTRSVPGRCKASC
jgi:hypothetical protein